MLQKLPWARCRLADHFAPGGFRVTIESISSTPRDEPGHTNPRPRSEAAPSTPNPTPSRSAAPRWSPHRRAHVPVRHPPRFPVPEPHRCLGRRRIWQLSQRGSGEPTAGDPRRGIGCRDIAGRHPVAGCVPPAPGGNLAEVLRIVGVRRNSLCQCGSEIGWRLHAPQRHTHARGPRAHQRDIAQRHRPRAEVLAIGASLRDGRRQRDIHLRRTVRLDFDRREMIGLGRIRKPVHLRRPTQRRRSCLGCLYELGCLAPGPSGPGLMTIDPVGGRRCVRNCGWRQRAEVDGA